MTQTPQLALRFDSLQQEAYLALWRTYDRLRSLEDELFGGFDLTAQQYNLLRLLAISHPDLVPTLSLVRTSRLTGARRHADARPSGAAKADLTRTLRLGSKSSPGRHFEGGPERA